MVVFIEAKTCDEPHLCGSQSFQNIRHKLNCFKEGKDWMAFVPNGMDMNLVCFFDPNFHV